MRAPYVERLPGFDAGEVSVQDPAAQRAAHCLDLQSGQRVLDACAAPGGKSAHLLELADVALTALDIDASRAARIAPNLERLDRINYRLLGWGFLLLSLAIVSGAIWARTTWGRFWSWEPIDAGTRLGGDDIIFGRSQSLELCSVWGSAANDVWAVGGPNGTTLHWTGTAWANVAAGTTDYLLSVWGAAFYRFNFDALGCGNAGIWQSRQSWCDGIGPSRCFFPRGSARGPGTADAAFALADRL